MSTTYSGGGYAILATTTTGSESAPSGSSAGLNLAGNDSGYVYKPVRAVAVHIEAADGTTNLTGASSLLCYHMNPQSGNWARLAELDLVLVGAAPRECWGSRSVDVGVGRLTWIPSGVGTAVKIYINADPGSR